MKEVDTSELEQTFHNWLNEPWPHSAKTDRQKFWLAFKAGAEWAMKEIRQNAGLPVNGRAEHE